MVKESSVLVGDGGVCLDRFEGRVEFLEVVEHGRRKGMVLPVREDLF